MIVHVGNGFSQFCGECQFVFVLVTIILGTPHVHVQGGVIQSGKTFKEVNSETFWQESHFDSY